METFLKAVVEKYNGDFVKPGVVFAWLPDSKEFYGSVVRYPDNKVNKTVQCSFKAPTFNACVYGLMDAWREKLQPRQTNLDKFLGVKTVGCSTKAPSKLATETSG